jgi:hypothetical protein
MSAEIFSDLSSLALDLRTQLSSSNAKKLIPDKAMHERMINVVSHADDLIHDPQELFNSYVEDFRKIFRKFIDGHSFNLGTETTATP